MTRATRPPRAGRKPRGLERDRAQPVLARTAPPGDASTRGAGRAGHGARPIWIGAGLSALVGWLLFLPTRSFQFVWDDHHLIGSALRKIQPAQLFSLLVSDFWASTGSASGYWRPLVALSYWLDGRAGQWDPALFHVANLIAHGLVSALVAWWAFEWTSSVAAGWVAGLAFATMPAHVESVAWIAGRTDVYCAAGLVLALLADARAQRSPRAGWLALAMAGFGAALLAKETAIVFLPLAALTRWVGRARGTAPGRERRRTGWGVLAAYAGLAIVYVALHARLVPAPPPAGELGAAGVAASRRAALALFPRYLAFAWPAFDHTAGLQVPAPASLLAPEVWGGIAALAAAVVGIGALAFARRRIAVPLAIVVLALIPVIAGAWVRGDVLYAERFFYLPSIGLCAAFGIMMAAPIARWPRAAFAGVVVVLAIQAAISFSLLPRWRDDRTLFGDMIRRVPRNAMAHVVWADLAGERGDDEEAERHYAIAESLQPRAVEIFLGRGAIALKHGRWPAVLVETDRALALDPRDLRAGLMKTGVLLRLGRLEEARQTLAPLRALRPDHPAVVAAWGEYLLSAGKPDEAFAALGEANRRIDDDADLAYAWGMASGRLSRMEEARLAFEKAVRIDPNFYQAWLRLAVVEHSRGDIAARDLAIQRAVALPESRDGRAIAQARAWGLAAPEAPIP